MVTNRKYGNRRTSVGADTFDSKKEARRWADLLILLRAGEISDLKRQVSYELLPSVKLNGKTKRAMTYRADFVYRDKGGATIVEDAKGFITSEFRIKQHLMKHVYGIEIALV